MSHCTARCAGCKSVQAKSPRREHGPSRPDEDLDAILANPEVSATAKLIILTLVRCWAWSKDHCWPSDMTIARKIGMSLGHVRRCLRELETAGLITREQDCEVGRIIWLRWRQISCMDEMEHCAPARIDPLAPARTEEFRTERMKEERYVTTPSSTQSANQDSSSEPTPEPLGPPASLPAPPVEDPPAPVSQADVLPVPEPIPAPQPVTQSPQPDQALKPLPEAIKALPGADQGQIRMTVARISQAMADQTSIGFYFMAVSLVARGLAPPQQLLDAYRAGMGVVGRSGRPGALFCWTWKQWTKPPKPSQINQPQYHRAQCPATPEVVVIPDEGEGEVEELRSWLAQPRHPFATYARERLAELGAAPA